MTVASTCRTLDSLLRRSFTNVQSVVEIRMITDKRPGITIQKKSNKELKKKLLSLQLLFMAEVLKQKSEEKNKS